MFLREERIAILILLCTTAAILSVYAAIELQGREAYAREFNISMSDGSLVKLNGVADKVVTTMEGGHVVMNIDDVRVFVPAGALPEKGIKEGDHLSLYGVVQTYRGQKEVMVGSAKDITFV